MTTNAISQGVAGEQSHSVVFVDAGLAGLDALLAQLPEGIEIVRIGAGDDALSVMADWAEGKSGYASVHVFSHGAAGSLALGSAPIDAAAIEARAVDLAQFSSALTGGADILLYGCAVGAGDAGNHFVEALAKATGADVAASDDLTGAAARGGDWALEVATGPIETAAFTAPAWDATLAVSYTVGDLFPNLVAGTNGSTSTTFQFQVGDFDHDGDIDLLYWNGSSDSYYRNDGGGSFTHFATLAGTPFSGLSILPDYGAQYTAFEDFNGDGAKDFFFLGGGAYHYLTYSGGNYVESTSPFTALGVSTTKDAFLAGDFDSDGDIDLVYWTGSASAYYRNDGGGSFTNITDMSLTPFAGVVPPNYGYQDTLVADFDGDGDNDITFYAGDLGRFVYLRNDHGHYSDVASPFPDLPTAAPGLFTPLAGDFDSDGDVDVLFYNGTDDAYYRNDGNGQFTLITGAAGTPFAGLGSNVPDYSKANVQLADFDGDGDLDVLQYAGGDHFTLTQNGAPPKLVSSTPGDDAMGVATTANVTLTFNEAVFAGAGKITLHRSSDNSVVETFAANDARVTGSGTTTITIDFATTLAGNTGYYLTFETKAFVDADGMTFGQLQGLQRTGITDSGFLNFVTAAANTPPAMDVNTGETLAEGGTVIIDSGHLHAHDLEAVSDADLTFTITSAPTNGTLFRNGVALALNDTFTQADVNNLLITYTHDGGETTSASFGFSLSDGAGGSITDQTFNFTVTAVNDAPTFGATLDGAPTFTQHGAPVVLDADVAIFDVELHAAGSYEGASLTLVRHGAASAGDVFGVSGGLAFAGGHALLNGVDIGTMTNVKGELVVTFNANATEARVNELMESITYRNNGSHPPASVQIDWTFSDGNSGGQGAGGALNATGSTTVQIIADATTNGDFGGDHISDILWRNTSGEVALWQLDNTGHAVSMLRPGTVATSWHIEDTGDFNNDGKADILWRNDSGQTVIWTMDGNNVTSTINLGGVGTAWQIQGAADVNGDGVSDIVWRNSTTGGVAVWTMTDTGQVSATTSYGNISSAYHIQALADFNGDGTDDILWRNDNGQVALWQMDGSQVVASAVSTLSTAWHIQGAGDFNGDGTADILWRNDSGQAAIWFMNSAQVTNAQSIGNQGSGWTIETTGDYNGDGKDDILWHNDTSGQTVEWLMNGAQVASIVDLGKVPTTWSVAHHEFDLV